MPADDHPADDIDRDRFYAADLQDDDDGEYELEPLDPEVLAAEKRLADQAVSDAEGRIDVDELFRPEEKYDHDELLKQFGKFRFRTRHLLIGTALFALFLAVATIASFGLALLLLVLGGAAAALVYLNRREQRTEAELERRKQAFRAEMRRRAANRQQTAPPPDEAEVDWHDSLTKHESFRFSFSTRELLIAFTVAAVLMGFISMIGPANGALVLGLAALVGLAVHAAGYEPARGVILAWWMLLMLYIMLTLCAAFWDSAQTTATASTVWRNLV